MNYQQHYDSINALIKEGQAKQASDLILKLNFKSMPDKWRQPFADLCRRSWDIQSGLKILKPLIESSHHFRSLTPKDLCTYAGLLQRNGSLLQAIKTLHKVNTQQEPEALLLEALCQMPMWNYHLSVPLLNNYIQTVRGDLYKELIGKVNLSSGYLFLGFYKEAEAVLLECLQTAKQLKAWRLQGNSYELLAHSYWRQNQILKAKDCIAHAYQLLKGEDSPYTLFVKKIEAIIMSHEHNDPEYLLKFKSQALKLSHAESVREADFYLLRFKFDSKAYQHLYFGTPYTSYRQKLIKEIAPEPNEETFILSSSVSKKQIDLTKENAFGVSAKSGYKIHSLINAFFMDFYKPLNLGQLFYLVFPDEKFDPYSSPDKIHQLLRRTRRVLEDHDLKLNFTEDKGSYSVSYQDVNIILPKNRITSTSHHELNLNKIKSTFNLELFTSKEVQSVLNISLATANRLLKKGIDTGSITTEGKGPGTLYRFVA